MGKKLNYYATTRNNMAGMGGPDQTINHIDKQAELGVPHSEIQVELD